MQKIVNIANPIWGSMESSIKGKSGRRAVGKAALLSCFSHVKQRNSL